MMTNLGMKRSCGKLLRRARRLLDAWNFDAILLGYFFVFLLIFLDFFFFFSASWKLKKINLPEVPMPYLRTVQAPACPIRQVGAKKADFFYVMGFF